MTNHSNAPAGKKDSILQRHHLGVSYWALNLEHQKICMAGKPVIMEAGFSNSFGSPKNRGTYK